MERNNIKGVKNKYLNLLVKSCISLLKISKKSTAEKLVKDLKESAISDIKEILSIKNKRAGGRKNADRIKPLTATDYKKLAESKIQSQVMKNNDIVLNLLENRLEKSGDLESKEFELNERIKEHINKISEIRKEVISIRHESLLYLDYN